MSAVNKNARKLEPGHLVSLFEIDYSIQGAEPPDNKLYLHPYVKLAGGTIPFMGHTFQPFPIHIEGLDYNTQGTVPRPKVIVSNIDSIVTALLRQYGDFVACIVTRRRTYSEYLDDGAEHGTPPNYDDAHQFQPDIFSIERKVQETATFVEFELSSAWDTEGVSLPRRQILSSFCPWLYRGTECSYVGPPVADKDDNPIVVAPGAVEFDDDGSYSLGDWVYTGTPIIEVPGPGGVVQHYRSLVNANTFALSDATKWYYAGAAYDSGRTYTNGDYAYVMVNGIRVYYASLADANTSPLTDKTKWVRDDCSKRVIACKARFGSTNPLPFGGFPGAGRIPGGA